MPSHLSIFIFLLGASFQHAAEGSPAPQSLVGIGSLHNWANPLPFFARRYRGPDFIINNLVDGTIAMRLDSLLGSGKPVSMARQLFESLDRPISPENQPLGTLDSFSPDDLFALACKHWILSRSPEVSSRKQELHRRESERCFRSLIDAPSSDTNIQRRAWAHLGAAMQCNDDLDCEVALKSAIVAFRLRAPATALKASLALAGIYFRQGKSARAIETLERVVAKAKGLDEFRDLMLAKAQLGDYVKGRGTLPEVLRRLPTTCPAEVTLSNNNRKSTLEAPIISVPSMSDNKAHWLDAVVEMNHLPVEVMYGFTSLTAVSSENDASKCRRTIAIQADQDGYELINEGGGPYLHSKLPWTELLKSGRKLDGNATKFLRQTQIGLACLVKESTFQFLVRDHPLLHELRTRKMCTYSTDIKRTWGQEVVIGLSDAKGSISTLRFEIGPNGDCWMSGY